MASAHLTEKCPKLGKHEPHIWTVKPYGHSANCTGEGWASKPSGQIQVPERSRS